MSPSRNDPCPCGSGRRYKRCCGALQAPAASAQTPQTLQAPDIGALAALINQDRLVEAENLARELLQSYPRSGGLWKIISVALARQGKDASQELRKATELLPDDAEAHRNLGAVLLEQGHLQEALATLRRVLEIEPDDVEVLMGAANALCALGRPRDSVALYRRAAQINPHSPEAHNNLGNALQALGECAEAVGCYRLALAIAPDDAETLSNLSNALRQLGQLHEAATCSERAIALEPQLSVAHNNLGLALAALGRDAEAAASFRQAVQLNPHFVEALNNLGNALRAQGNHGEALSLYRAAVELMPQRADIRYNLGNALYELGRVAESVASFRTALTLQPDYAPAHLGLATALRLQGRVPEAEASCRAALATEPNSAAALCLLGDLCADRGEFGQAQDLFQRALAIDADFPALFCSIAAHRKMTRADVTWLEGAEALLAKRLPLAHEIGLRYALGKYHDDVRQYDEAFSQYRQANELSKRHTAKYDRGKLTEQVDQVIDKFGSAFVRESHPGASVSELPVFVIGMPRSGTSLSEQILASHPEVFGAGEPKFWDGAFEAFMSTRPERAATASAFSGMARDYLERLTAGAGAARRVVDKMPANFLYAGLIHAVFPRAKILHMQRHPLDTCLSIYFQNFSALHPYAADFDDLVHYYSEYVRVTNHWRAVLPATTLLEIPYEALIEDQEHWSRRMLEFIGMPWDPQCLEFHQTQRVIITASRWQVRQRINAASVARWRNYEKYVAPLRQLLDLVATGQRPSAAGAPPAHPTSP
ncbi:MAG: tetratricopeptide repeat protein [Steroidobacteraceae bacterium]